MPQVSREVSGGRGEDGDGAIDVHALGGAEAGHGLVELNGG